MKTKIDLKLYVLIQVIREIRISSNENRFGGGTKGFSITTPMAGLMLKEDWEYLKEFMAIKMEDVIMDNVFLTDPKTVVPEEDMIAHEGVRKLTDLQERSGSFKNSVHEFNIIIAEDADSYLTTVRCHALLGVLSWKEVIVEEKRFPELKYSDTLRGGFDMGNA